MRLGLGSPADYAYLMWGRVRLSSNVSEIKLAFPIPPHRPTPNFPPTWNGAPTDLLPVVRYDVKGGERSLDLLRWGLVPYWAKDIKVASPTSTPRPRGLRTSQPSVTHSSAAAAPSRPTTFTNGRKPRQESS